MPTGTNSMVIRASRIPINWHPDLSIFASEPFLKAVGDEYGWIGGTDDSGKLLCILPYTVIRKSIFRMVRFRIETIPMAGGLNVNEEKSFLNSVIKYFQSINADMIIPASTNTIFRTYPDGADAAPYGTYVINLNQDEKSLWSKVSKTFRKNINKANRIGIQIKSGLEHLESAYGLIYYTFKRSSLPFMSYKSFKKYIYGLGNNVKILIADYEGSVQSCTVYPFSNHCAYAVYGGSVSEAVTGAMKLVQWEAIRMFREIGVHRLDLVGGRISPKKGSKEEGIVTFKQKFGAELISGYIWKHSFRPLKYRLYCLAAHIRSGGDIVDHERHKLKRE